MRVIEEPNDVWPRWRRSLTRGCIASISPAPPAADWFSPPTATVASSSTPWPNGLDAVAEWARRRGEAFNLELVGPDGATFTQGTRGAVISLDAVELCRIFSGRATGTSLLTQEVPF